MNTETGWVILHEDSGEYLHHGRGRINFLPDGKIELENATTKDLTIKGNLFTDREKAQSKVDYYDGCVNLRVVEVSVKIEVANK